MKSTQLHNPRRRSLLKAAAGLGGIGLGGVVLSLDALAQDIPVKCFASGLQQHPYTFFSLKKKPVNTPKDMAGKKVGIQPTGVVLLRALLAKNNIPESAVEIIPIGADMSPLLTGQVDVVTGWQTNVT